MPVPVTGAAAVSHAFAAAAVGMSTGVPALFMIAVLPVVPAKIVIRLSTPPWASPPKPAVPELMFPSVVSLAFTKEKNEPVLLALQMLPSAPSNTPVLGPASPMLLMHAVAMSEAGFVVAPELTTQ